MSSSNVIYEQVLRFLPTDDVDIGVAILEYAVEDAKAAHHSDNYVGLTQKAIEKRLRDKGMSSSGKHLQGVLEKLDSSQLIQHRRGHHYFAPSRFVRLA